jgi:hypothetical protein
VPPRQAAACWLFAILIPACAGATVPTARAGLGRGVTLGLFGPEPAIAYSQQLDEIQSLGATDVSLLVTGFVWDIQGSEVFAWPGMTSTPEQVMDLIGAARKRGLETMVFPILRLGWRGQRDWRGILRPADEAAFFDSYERFILAYAQAAQRAGASAFVVGSELGSTQHREQRWRSLIARVRAVFAGRLLYSANWDAYEAVPFWDALDAIGVSAYYELSQDPARRPAIEAMVAAWAPIRQRLVAFARAQRKPLVLTELGYPSRVGAASSPWDDARPLPPDQEEQRRCFVAFARAFADAQELAAVYLWLWSGRGGPSDASYTPRGKAAELMLREFYRPRVWLPPAR